MRHRIVENSSPSKCSCCGSYGAESGESVNVPTNEGKDSIDICNLCVREVINAKKSINYNGGPLEGIQYKAPDSWVKK